MIKKFAANISKAPMDEISVEIGDKQKCVPMIISIPECYSTDDFQDEMGNQLKLNRHTLFKKIPKNIGSSSTEDSEDAIRVGN